MLDRTQEAELFELLSRNASLRGWITGKLEIEMKVLMQNPDVVQLHRAQGRSLMLQTMLDLMPRK